MSFPKTAGAMPYFYNHKMKSGGFPIHPDFGAIFPFGFGLSYTSFDYVDCSVAKEEIPVDGKIEVSCTVRNTGGRAGDEVIQLYIRDRNASLVRPVKELKGFRRISLTPGKAAKVAFSLPADMLGFTRSGVDRIVEPGEVEIMLGSSSEDIKYRTTVILTGEARELPQQWNMHCDSTAVPV